MRRFCTKNWWGGYGKNEKNRDYLKVGRTLLQMAWHYDCVWRFQVSAKLPIPATTLMYHTKDIVYSASL